MMERVSNPVISSTFEENRLSVLHIFNKYRFAILGYRPGNAFAHFKTQVLNLLVVQTHHHEKMEFLSFGLQKEN